ncbi:MAG: NUDIX domain-containing protein [Gemmatimonadaceae bacterium]|nr:NUDIX domain-containing protein [Gemmatimonadaceae bacterium]
MNTPLETRIGVGILVVRDGCVLLGERLGSHGAGTWAPPGGHLEDGEDIAACAARELREETGLLLGDWHAGPWSVDAFPEIGRRYVTLFLVADRLDGEPQLCEPDKCAQWRWFPWTDLPSPLFSPLASLVASGQRPVA